MGSQLHFREYTSTRRTGERGTKDGGEERSFVSKKTPNERRTRLGKSVSFPLPVQWRLLDGEREASHLLGEPSGAGVAELPPSPQYPPLLNTGVERGASRDAPAVARHGGSSKRARLSAASSRGDHFKARRAADRTSQSLGSDSRKALPSLTNQNTGSVVSVPLDDHDTQG